MTLALRNPARFGGQLDLGQGVSAPDAGPVPGGLRVDGQSPALHLTATLLPGVGALTLAGLLATAFTGTLLPGAGSLRLAGAPTAAWAQFQRLTLRDQSTAGVLHLRDAPSGQAGLGALQIEGQQPQVVTTGTAEPPAAALVLQGHGLARGLIPAIEPGVGRIVFDPTVKVLPIHRLPTFLRNPVQGGGHLDLSEADPTGGAVERTVQPGLCSLHLDTVMYGCIRPPLGLLEIHQLLLRAYGIIWFDQARFAPADWTGPTAAESALWSLTVADTLAWALAPWQTSASWSGRAAAAGAWGPDAAAATALVWYDRAASSAAWSATAAAASTGWSPGAPVSAAWSPAGPVTASFDTISPVTAATWSDA